MSRTKWTLLLLLISATPFVYGEEPAHDGWIKELRASKPYVALCEEFEKRGVEREAAKFYADKAALSIAFRTLDERLAQLPEPYHLQVDKLTIDVADQQYRPVNQASVLSVLDFVTKAILIVKSAGPVIHEIVAANTLQTCKEFATSKDWLQGKELFFSEEDQKQARALAKDLVKVRLEECRLAYVNRNKTEMKKFGVCNQRTSNCDGLDVWLNPAKITEILNATQAVRKEKTQLQDLSIPDDPVLRADVVKWLMTKLDLSAQYISKGVELLKSMNHSKRYVALDDQEKEIWTRYMVTLEEYVSESRRYAAVIQDKLDQLLHTASKEAASSPRSLSEMLNPPADVIRKGPVLSKEETEALTKYYEQSKEDRQKAREGFLRDINELNERLNRTDESERERASRSRDRLDEERRLGREESRRRTESVAANLEERRNRAAERARSRLAQLGEKSVSISAEQRNRLRGVLRFENIEPELPDESKVQKPAPSDSEPKTKKSQGVPKAPAASPANDKRVPDRSDKKEPNIPAELDKKIRDSGEPDDGADPNYFYYDRLRGMNLSEGLGLKSLFSG